MWLKLKGNLINLDYVRNIDADSGNKVFLWYADRSSGDYAVPLGQFGSEEDAQEFLEDLAIFLEGDSGRGPLVVKVVSEDELRLSRGELRRVVRNPS